ncbi:MAG TPA: VOC family protein [Candidatus Acidoferrales bacterium]|nr:VOC family protein [Candidatus Acidoferrales bacterium]
MSAVKSIPEKYHNITPYLYVKGAVAAIEFYTNAFGAKQIFLMPGPSGRIMHAELQFGESIVMLADEDPARGIMSPHTVGGYSVGLHLYIENVDEVMRRALENGAKQLHPVKDQVYGDRSGSLLDPFGHMWTVATHIEDVSPEELQRRLAAMNRSASA